MEVSIHAHQFNGARTRQRPLLELSRETWDKAKYVFKGTSFFGTDATRDELMACHYMLQMQKKKLRRERRELDDPRARAGESSRRCAALSSIGNERVGAGAGALGNCNRRS
jgi:hypothetical protein